MKPGPNRKANVWTARVIPVLLIAIIVYSTWVITKVICVDYLLHPPTALTQPHQGPAIAILVLYYLLLIPLLICFGRLIQTIVTNPGYVPRSAQWHAQKESRALQKTRSRRRSRSSPTDKEKHEIPPKNDTLGQPNEEYWRRDVFVCQYDGRPPFCSQCFTFKLDRVHHCSEVNRCVVKMDHFCPWVGGIVSETSFKLFIQFTFYTAAFTFFNLVVIAYYFAERRRLESGFLNVHWILSLAFASLFFLLGSGMFGSSFQLTCLNTTTVENLSRHTKVHYLAVHMPKPEEILRKNEAVSNTGLRTITYPRPPEEQLMILQQHGATPIAADLNRLGDSQTSSDKPAQPTGMMGAPKSRTFAILETTRGTNPWDLGVFENIKQVMGERLIDWFIPLRHSPCTNHDSLVSMYKMNPEIEEFKRAARISDEEQSRQGRWRRRRKSHASRHSGDESGTERIHRSRHHSRRRDNRADKVLADPTPHVEDV